MRSVAPSVAKGTGQAKSWPAFLPFALAAGLGLGAFQWFSRLPPLWIPLLCALLAAVLAWRWRRWSLPAVAALAFAWGVWQAQQRVQVHWPARQAELVTLVGEIVSPPQPLGRETHFLVAPRWIDAGRQRPFPARIDLHGRLPEEPQSGQIWQFKAHLQPASALPASPFGDAARQRFWANIRATGGIQYAQRLDDPPWTPVRQIEAWRQSVAAASNAILPRAEAGFVQALSVGMGGQIPATVWAAFRDTGTAHLLVISGSHVAVVAGLVFWLTQWLWRRVPWLVNRYPAMLAASVASIPTAWAYALFAGFALPAERAALMITAAALARCMGRRSDAWSGLALAALWICLENPGAIREISFWLSFGAVAVLVLVAFVDDGQAWWRRLLTSQWAVSIALLPLLAGVFGQIPLISPLANLLVIPLVELFAVPTALLGALATLLGGDGLARLCFHLVAVAMHGVVVLLEALLRLPYATVVTGRPSFPALLAAGLGLSLFFLPRAWPGRWLGVVGVLPLLLPAPLSAALEVELLPAGEGTLLFWRQQGHSGIFTANLWRKSEAREAALWLQASTLRHGVTSMESWVRSDSSAPEPLPRVQRQWWPSGAKDYPGGPLPPLLCAAAGAAPPGGSFLTATLPQSCVLLLGGPRGPLLAGDLDGTAIAALRQRYGARLAQRSALFVPASLTDEERRQLQATAPSATLIVAAGSAPALRSWRWLGNRLQEEGAIAKAYWE
jgi:competence protein ComEC